ncbi:MAG TPA: DoxX family protein [Xanthobacteraceae bacterium]|nr:DoxX family protein [Xanthobacteraceae bacterium]
MHILFLIGRIAFVLIFLASGIFKLMDIAGTARVIEQKFTIPSVIEPFAANLSSMTGLTTFQMLAIILALIEVVFSLFIIFNVATRFSAFVLAIVMAVGTYYVHDFWNMTGDERIANIEMLIRNISIIGGLLMLMVIGPWRPTLDEDEQGVYAR